MLRADVVVAVSQHDGARHRLQPAHEETQYLDRCAVDPVQVLDDQHGGFGAQPVVGGFACPGERAIPVQRAEIGDEVAEWAEWPRRRQRVTPAAEDAQPGRLCAGDLNESGLAGPRFTGDRDAGTTAGRRTGQRPGENVQLTVPLEEAHAVRTFCMRSWPSLRSVRSLMP